MSISSTLRTLAALVLLSAVALGFSIVLKLKAHSEEPSVQSTRRIAVATTKVTWITSWKDQVALSGVVRPRRSSKLSFERVGRVDQIHVELGDHVEPGSVLAELNTDTLRAQLRKLESDIKVNEAVLEELKAGPRQELIEAARARVLEVDAQLKSAMLSFERRSRLRNTEAISEEDFESAKAMLDRMSASKSVAENTLSDLKLGTRREKIDSQTAMIQSLKESMDLVRIEIEHSSIRAPYKGIVTEIYVHEGHVSAPGEPVFAFSADSEYEAIFGVPPIYRNEILQSDVLSVEIHGKQWPCKLKSVIPEVEEATRNLRVIAALPVDEGLAPIAGELATVHLDYEKKDEGFWLPVPAIEPGLRGLWECYVVEDRDGVTVATRRPVEVISTEGDRVLVRGSVAEGEQVVTTAIQRLSDGHPVTVSNEDEAQ